MVAVLCGSALYISRAEHPVTIIRGLCESTNLLVTSKAGCVNAGSRGVEELTEWLCCQNVGYSNTSAPISSVPHSTGEAT